MTGSKSRTCCFIYFNFYCIITITAGCGIITTLFKYYIILYYIILYYIILYYIILYYIILYYIILYYIILYYIICQIDCGVMDKQSMKYVLNPRGRFVSCYCIHIEVISAIRVHESRFCPGEYLQNRHIITFCNLLLDPIYSIMRTINKIQIQERPCF